MSGIETSARELLAQFRERQAVFERELWALWQPAFDLYDAVLMEARQAAGFFIKRYRDEAARNQDMLFEAQTRLQARAYRTASEIRALLLSGNPDGALARWRTLFEVLVVMLFLEKHGADTADRYLKYDALQRAKTLRLFERNSGALGHAPLLTGQAEDIRRESAELIKAWAADERSDNVWAAQALGSTKPQGKISLARLAEHVDLGPHYLYYSLASEHIHANVKGLGGHPSEEMTPSMRQLSLAGYEGMARLADCTNIMVRLRPTGDTERLTDDLRKLVQAGARVFQEIERQLEQPAP